MRSSIILASLGATLAIATPLAHDRLHKKAYVYDIVTDIVYVTVTENEVPPSATTVKVEHTVYVDPVEATPSTHTKKVKPTTATKPTSTYVAPPPPPPTTSSTPPPAPTTAAEAPAPTTEAAAVEATTPAPVEAPAATYAAPVVEAASPTPTAAAASTPDTSSNALAGPGVDKHNTCRSSHSAESVSWNETLAKYAATTAATCVFAHDMTEGGGGYGQNIASQGSSSSNAWTLESALENAIISEWYSEASLFTNLYGQESPQETSGEFLHFTQIVWKNSLEIGCAVQACPTSNSIFPGMYTWFTVCNYYPQGNVEGEFAQNVLPS